MLTFVHNDSVPPGGKYFFDTKVLKDYGVVMPEGFEPTARMEHPTESAVRAMVRTYLQGNKIPVPESLNAIITDFMCRSLPDGFCKGTTSLPRTKFLSTSQIMEGTRLVFQKIRMSSEEFFVSPEEAARRARICATCPANLHGICTSCTSGLKELASRLISNRSTPFDNFLDTCAHCGCALRAKIHVSVKALSVTQKHEYPSGCWLHGTVCDSNAKVAE